MSGEIKPTLLPPENLAGPALSAVTMVMMYEEATGKKFDHDTMDDYVNYCDGYCDGYNKGIE
jgi:hypothetical protein